MGHNERKAYLDEIRLIHRMARKLLRVKILDEFYAVCGSKKNRKLAFLSRQYLECFATKS